MTYYERNKTKAKAARAAYRHSTRGKEMRKQYRREVSREASEYVLEYLLQHPCTRCPESDPTCLQFHHRDPTEKEMNIGALIHGGQPINIEKLKEEIAKCDVLCANCHLKYHAKENRTFRYQQVKQITSI